MSEIETAPQEVEVLDQDSNEEISSGSVGGPSQFGSLDVGRADTLRYNILQMVAEEKYDHAIKEFAHFLEVKKSYPTFHSRVFRYVEHCVSLVRAIKAKRRFPGYNTLSKSKRQELSEIVKNHFGELTMMLKKIEAIEIELRMEDLRSTVWVLKTGVYVIGGIITAALLIEVNKGLLINIRDVIADSLGNTAAYILNVIGL